MWSAQIAIALIFFGFPLGRCVARDISVTPGKRNIFPDSVINEPHASAGRLPSVLEVIVERLIYDYNIIQVHEYVWFQPFGLQDLVQQSLPDPSVNRTASLGIVTVLYR